MGSGLLSDSHIHWKRSILVIAIMALCLYSHHHPAELSVKQYLDEPEAHAGQRITVAQHTRISRPGHESFEVTYMGHPIIIRGSSEGFKSGELVMLYGTILDDGSISLIRIKTRKLRSLKIYFSIPAAFFVAIIVLRRYRIRTGPLRVDLR